MGKNTNKADEPLEQVLQFVYLDLAGTEQACWQFLYAGFSGIISFQFHNGPGCRYKYHSHSHQLIFSSKSTIVSLLTPSKAKFLPQLQTRWVESNFLFHMLPKPLLLDLHLLQPSPLHRMFWMQLPPQYTQKNFRPPCACSRHRPQRFQNPHRILQVLQFSSLLFLDHTFSGRPLSTSLKETAFPALAACPLA